MTARVKNLNETTIYFSKGLHVAAYYISDEALSLF